MIKTQFKFECIYSKCFQIYHVQKESQDFRSSKASLTLEVKVTSMDFWDISEVKTWKIPKKISK